MDPETNLPDLIDDLEANIDDLTSTLAPLLSKPLPQTATTLPLLDKAKLHVLAAYAIESLLFSTLQASGANAKSHAVFAELARLKGYFAKIKEAEEQSTGAGKPQVRIDKEAAARFIKHGLAGNARYDAERAERIAKEKARAALKARQLNVKFDQEVEGARQAELTKKRKAAAAEDNDSSSSSSSSEDEDEEEEEREGEEADHVDSENEDFYGTTTTTTTTTTQPDPQQPPPKKKSRLEPTDSSHPSTPSSSKKSKKRKDTSTSSTTTTPSNPPPKRARKRSSKKRSFAVRAEEELVLPSQQAPRTHGETFSALLDGSFAAQKKEKEGGGKKEGKRKSKGKGKKGK